MNRKAVPFIGGGALGLSFILFKFFAWVQMMPEAAAEEAFRVDYAFNGMLVLTIPIFSLVMATLVYSLFFFRARSPEEQGEKFHQSRGRVVEILWILVSLMLTLGIAAFGSVELKHLQGEPSADLDVQVTASQYSWEFYYPAQNEYGSRLILPQGKRVRLLLNSADVVHSFWVPQFRVKQDVVPGKVIKLYLTPTKIGAYTLTCAELCGAEHTDMTSAVEVVATEEFESRISGEAW